MKSLDILLKSLDVICESRLWKDAQPSEVLKILMYMNNKSFLYTSKSAMIGAYRINEGDDLFKLPIKEEGNILYVPFVVSFNKDNNIYRDVREITKEYLKDNQDINEIILENKNGELKRYKIGEFHGQCEETEFASNADVSK